MSKNATSIARQNTDLSDVKVEVVRHKERRKTPTAAGYDGGKRGVPTVSNRANNFVYVNSAYVGSLNSVNEARIHEPPTSVYREQYWACSKWSFAKKVLAIVAGVVMGAAIGLAVTLAIKGGKAEDVIGGIFRQASSAPD